MGAVSNRPQRDYIPIMFRMIPDLIATIRGALPPWAFVLLMLALAAVALPAWFHSIRSKQIRTRLRWYGRAHSDDERHKWSTEAFALAGTHGRRLVVLAEEAHKLNQDELYKRAIGMLHESGQCPEDVKRLDEQTLKERPRYRHPLEATVAIERLVSEGMTDEARTRLAEARQHFPDDGDLSALETALAEDSPAA